MRTRALFVLAALLVASSAGGQTAQTFTLDQAIAYAAEHYPTVRAAIEQVSATEAGIDVARAAYLPRLDGVWQSNRATVRNVFGQLLPQSVIPAMSGPVLQTAPDGSTWGSAAGALLSWEPIDFGLRSATVAGAEAALTRARASERLTRLDVQRAVAESFLAAVGAQRTVVSAAADLERRRVLATSARVLVDNQLRPGAEASRADAERAAAEIRLIHARAAETVALMQLARLLGADGTVAIDAASLLDQVPPPGASFNSSVAHPLVQVRQAALEDARAQQQVLSRSNLPRVFAQSSVFARGSGAHPDGLLDGGAGGLGFERANWAAGFQLVVPNVFEFSALRARKASAAAAARAQSALYDESVLTITSQQQAAGVMMDAARTVAQNTPVQLEAARQTEAQARARYEAGLASIIEVAEAQSLLAFAETQDQLARVDLWRAAVASASAWGDLSPVLRLVRP